MISALCVAACLAGPAPAAPPATLAAWTPDVAAARAYAARRRGSVSFAVRTEGRFFGHRTTLGVPSASTIKAILLVAYLRRGSVRGRALRPADRRLLDPMVRRSDNVAATRVRDVVGAAGLSRLARRARMRRLRVHPVWGLSRVDASDLTRFMLHVDRLVPPRHRAYAMGLLRTIVPSQRWGLARVAPSGWELAHKSGWGSGSGAVDHQVALLTRGRLRVSVAITTTANASHKEGKVTLRGVAARLLRGLERVEP